MYFSRVHCPVHVSYAARTPSLGEMHLESPPPTNSPLLFASPPHIASHHDAVDLTFKVMFSAWPPAAIEAWKSGRQRLWLYLMLYHHKLDYKTFGPTMRYIASNIFRNMESMPEVDVLDTAVEDFAVSPSLYEKTSELALGAPVFLRGCHFVRWNMTNATRQPEDEPQSDPWIFCPTDDNAAIPSASSLRYLRAMNVRGGEAQAARMRSLDQDLNLVAADSLPTVLVRSVVPNLRSLFNSLPEESDRRVSEYFHRPKRAADNDSDFTDAIESRFGKRPQSHQDKPTEERKNAMMPPAKQSKSVRSRLRNNSKPLTFTALPTNGIRCEWSEPPSPGLAVTIDMIFNETAQKLITVSGNPLDLQSPLIFGLKTKKFSRKAFVLTLDRYWNLK